MHLNWIRYFVRNHLDAMVAKSYRDCHARGVDSIMFDDAREGEIRLFIACKNHTLCANSPYVRDSELSIAFHPHHCDITLHVVKGEILNVRATDVSDERNCQIWPTYDRYLYQSHIREGESNFRVESRAHHLMLATDAIWKNESKFLSARTLRTVAVDEGKVAAWFVYEGKEDPDYRPLAYSNADLTQFSDEGMYRPMDRDYLLSALEEVFGPLGVSP